MMYKLPRHSLMVDNTSETILIETNNRNPSSKQKLTLHAMTLTWRKNKYVILHQQRIGMTEDKLYIIK